MKRNTQNDLRYIKTEALIQNTFREMLQEMDFTEATIQELVSRAQINRKTFYLHYQSLDELIRKLQIDLLTKLFRALPEEGFPHSFEDLIKKLFLFLANADDIDSKIISIQNHLLSGKSPQDCLKTKMLQYFKSYEGFSNYTEEEANIFVSYLYGSFVMVYSQWIIDGRKIPIETMTRLTAGLISQGIYGSKLLETRKTPS